MLRVDLGVENSVHSPSEVVAYSRRRAAEVDGNEMLNDEESSVVTEVGECIAELVSGVQKDIEETVGLVGRCCGDLRKQGADEASSTGTVEALGSSGDQVDNSRGAAARRGRGTDAAVAGGDLQR